MITLKEYILCQMREMKREMLTALSGLNQSDLAFTGPGNELPIGWVVQHCMCVIDTMLVYHISGKKLLRYPPGIDKYPIDPPPPNYAAPLVVDLENEWLNLMDHAIALLRSVDDEQLQSQSATGIEPLVESCLRSINHTNSHIRAIWCLIVQMGKTDRWPSQPSWMTDRPITLLRSELQEGLKLAGNHQSPFVRKLARKYAPSVLHHDNRSLWECCEDLMESRNTWQQMIACEWVHAAQDRTTPEDFYTFERWLHQYIFSWGTCDDFCKRVLNPYLEKDPSMIPRICAWTQSSNPWVRRASAVVFIRSEKSISAVSRPIAEVFEIANRLMSDQDIYVQKGLGWLLKAASVHEEEKVLEFLTQNRARMSRLSFRYALENMPPAKRDLVMRSNRKAG